MAFTHLIVELAMVSVASDYKTKVLDFGDLKIDAECMFAHHNGRKINFTRSERALLMVFTSNPRRLMSRSRLLDEIATRTAEPSDRNIDFLVNRLRAKLGDNARSPAFIKTQYGEGYLWIATLSATVPLEAFLVIGSTSELEGQAYRGRAEGLLDQIGAAISNGIGPERRVAIDGKDLRTTSDQARYSLHMSFNADHGRLNSAATLREMPSRRIIKTFRLHLDIADDASLAREASRVSDGVVAALYQALKVASSGLGLSDDDGLEDRLHRAAKRLSADNSAWLANGDELGRNRAQNPKDADAALQWCLHLFSRLVVTKPYIGLSLKERDGIETEIENTVLECLPDVETNPLLMLAAAKLLYFINRGHLDLAEDLAERASAPTQDFTAALPILGQMKYARGHYDEAIRLFDRGLDLATPGSEVHLHFRVLKCLALVARGDSGASAAKATDIGNMGPGDLRDINLMLGWTTAASNRPLPPASEQALQGLGAAGAAKALEYLYFTSARHILLETGRANVMRSMMAHISRVYGRAVIPDFVLRSCGAAIAV